MHSMDYSQYETYGFDRFSAFNLSTGYRERSYQAHWHSYGEIVLVGPGKTNVFKVSQNTYELVEGDFLLIWPMEMHEIIDADRKESLVIQFSNAFMNSLFDLQRIMHFYRNLHVLCINAHPRLVAGLRAIAEKMKEIFFSAGRWFRRSSFHTGGVKMKAIFKLFYGKTRNFPLPFRLPE